jgi:hypothetical protein
MTTVPTPAEFLASSEPDEEYDDLDPMTSFEHRLRMLESWVYELAGGAAPVAAVLDNAPCTDCEANRANYLDADADRQRLTSEVMSLAERTARAESLVEQIEAIVKKSTSQVSLAVKAAIEACRTPAETAEPEGEPAPDGHISKAERDQMLGTETPSPAPGAPAVDEAAGPGIPSQDVPQASAGEGSSSHSEATSENSGAGVLTQPAQDAPVEAWRTYARFLGHGRTGPAFNELEAMNRSQIRTLLGVEQPVTPVAE